MSRPRASSTTSCAPREDVVVGDRDRAEALRLCMLEQKLGLDAAVVRRVRVHVQVDDDPVAVAERIGLAPRRALACAQALVDVLELARDVGERLSLGRGPPARGPVHAVGLVVGEPAHLGRRELRLLLRAGQERPRRRLRRRPRARAREIPSAAGTKIAALLRIAARLGESRAVRTSTRSTSVRGTYGTSGERLRAQHRQRASPEARRACAAPRARAGAPSGATRARCAAPCPPARTVSCPLPRTRGCTRRGNARPLRRQWFPTPRAAGRSARAGARAVRAPAGIRGAPARRTSRPRDSRRRATRGTRGSAARARSRARRRTARVAARATGSFARRPARRRGCGARSEPPGRGRRARRRRTIRCGARRVPRRRSAARFDDAMIVTAWPSARSSRAIPATCSFTSCGCDQANGVTRQIRSAIAPRV